MPSTDWLLYDGAIADASYSRGRLSYIEGRSLNQRADGGIEGPWSFFIPDL